MTRLETAFNGAKDKAAAAESERQELRAKINDALALVKSGEIAPDDFISGCLNYTRGLPEDERPQYLHPLTHITDAFFRDDMISMQKTMAVMETIRHDLDDIARLDLNTQNILRGWTMRREEKRHHPKPS